MKLTLQIKLLPVPEQAEALLDTMRRFNAAASHAARVGWEHGVFSAPSIHKLCYRELRERFGLSSQMAVLARDKAAEVYKRDKSRCPEFRPLGAMTYDDRVLSFKGLDRASILTVALGRILVPMVHGQYQRERLGRLKGQIDLVHRDGKFFLHATIDLPEDPEIEVADYLGIDLGIVNLAVTSDGETFTGAEVEAVRRRFAKTRRNLQRRGTKSARRILKRLRRREGRFRRITNHVISKRIVAVAQGTGRGIALEELKGIRERVTVRRRQRARHHGWAFHQLRTFIGYKSRLVGVPVVAVDPRGSSRTCAACGHEDRINRRGRDTFVCGACGHAEEADLNAARVIAARARGLVTAPDKRQTVHAV